MKRHLLCCFTLMLLVSGAVAQAVPHKQGHANGVSKLATTTNANRDEALTVQHADVPSYPPIARTARVSGTVQVLVTVKDGLVINAKANSSANPLLVNAATDNVKTWKFSPQTDATFQTTYVYQLEKEEISILDNPHIEMQLPTIVRITARPITPLCNDCGEVVGGSGKKPFSRLSRAEQQSLNRRLSEYVKAYRIRNWTALYDLVSDTGKNGVNREMFIAAMKARHGGQGYSDMPDLLGFTANRSEDNENGLDVYGCGEATREGESYTGIAVIHTVHEHNTWSFSGWRFTEFPNEPCQDLSDPDWKPEEHMEWKKPMDELRVTTDSNDSDPADLKDGSVRGRSGWSNRITESAALSAPSTTAHEPRCFSIHVRLNGKPLVGPQAITLKAKQNESTASLEGGCFAVAPDLLSAKTLDVSFDVPGNNIHLSSIATGFLTDIWDVDLEDKKFGREVSLPKHARVRAACAVIFHVGEPERAIVQTGCRKPLSAKPIMGN